MILWTNPVLSELARHNVFMSNTDLLFPLGGGARAIQSDAQPLDRKPAAGSQTPVVVLGTHRSGTSLCMSVLHALGVRLDDDLVPGDANNERGYFESREIMELNESILGCLGVTWRTLFSIALPYNWAGQPLLEPARQKLVLLIKSKMERQPGIWGFKDPRTSVLLPLYRQAFTICGVEPIYILCLRNPAAVALSLRQRNNFPVLFSELLWLDNTLLAVQGAGKRLKAIVPYENWFHDGPKQIESLLAILGLQPGDLAESPAAMIDRLVAPALNHGVWQTGSFELACTETIYRLLLAGDLDGARAAFSEVRRALRMATYPLDDDGAPPSLYDDSYEPKRITCQLFWKATSQDDFNEADSCRAETDVGSTSSTVRLAVPAGIPALDRLRLDPSDSPGPVRLLALRLCNSGGSVLWQWDGKRETLEAEQYRNLTLFTRPDQPGVRAYFHNDDPNLVLPIYDELRHIAEKGGVLEFEFAWLRADSPESV
jgi:hypothetical protein